MLGRYTTGPRPVADHSRDPPKPPPPREPAAVAERPSPYTPRACRTRPRVAATRRHATGTTNGIHAPTSSPRPRRRRPPNRRAIHDAQRFPRGEIARTRALARPRGPPAGRSVPRRSPRVPSASRSSPCRCSWSWPPGRRCCRSSSARSWPTRSCPSRTVSTRSCRASWPRSWRSSSPSGCSWAWRCSWSRPCSNGLIIVADKLPAPDRDPGLGRDPAGPAGHHPRADADDRARRHDRDCRQPAGRPPGPRGPGGGRHHETRSSGSSGRLRNLLGLLVIPAWILTMVVGRARHQAAGARLFPEAIRADVAGAVPDRRPDAGEPSSASACCSASSPALPDLGRPADRATSWASGPSTTPSPRPCCWARCS